MYMEYDLQIGFGKQKSKDVTGRFLSLSESEIRLSRGLARWNGICSCIEQWVHCMKYA